MREHLVFLLAAPIASFGSYAGHERRGSEITPMRSAILGLVGAALGIDRMDKKGQSALRAYSVAVQSFQESTPLRDYHTVQTIPTAKARRPTSRSEALIKAGDKANTIITVRDYRCDVLIGVVLWGEGKWTLELIAKCIRQPKFPLYLGRKSCPLSSPLNPQIVSKAGPVEALASVEVPEWLGIGDSTVQERTRFPVHSDPITDHDPPVHRENVPGEPLDRTTWSFGQHEVWRLSGDGNEGEGAA